MAYLVMGIPFFRTNYVKYMRYFLKDFTFHATSDQWRIS